MVTESLTWLWCPPAQRLHRKVTKSFVLWKIFYKWRLCFSLEVNLAAFAKSLFLTVCSRISSRINLQSLMPLYLFPLPSQPLISQGRAKNKGAVLNVLNPPSFPPPPGLLTWQIQLVLILVETMVTFRPCCQLSRVYLPLPKGASSTWPPQEKPVPPLTYPLLVCSARIMVELYGQRSSTWHERWEPRDLGEGPGPVSYQLCIWMISAFFPTAVIKILWQKRLKGQRVYFRSRPRIQSIMAGRPRRQEFEAAYLHIYIACLQSRSREQ